MTTDMHRHPDTLGAKLTRLSLLVMGFMLITATTGTLYAHDGGFGHSRRVIMVSAVEDQATPGTTFYIDYRLRLSDEPALVELTQMDTNGDGAVSDDERDTFFTAKAEGLAKKMSANIKASESNNEKSSNSLVVTPVTFRVQHSLVQMYRFKVQVGSDVNAINWQDANYTHKPGSVRLYSGEGVDVQPDESVNMHHADRLALTIRRVAESDAASPKQSQEANQE